MATIKFGTTTDACRAGRGQRAELPEDNDDKLSIDPDRLVQCPFDKNHQIRVCRLPYHLLKCKKNHPKLARELKVCPFNACHLIRKEELTYHTETCENRTSLDLDSDTRAYVKVQTSTWVNPEMTEDWDQEADHHAPKFVWGQNTRCNQSQFSPTTNLGRGLRGPSVIPGLTRP